MTEFHPRQDIISGDNYLEYIIPFVQIILSNYLNYMKKFISLFLFLISIILHAQSFGNVHEVLYEYQVKGIGEFMARFNSDEHLKFDMQLPDSISQRKKDILSVCNFEIAQTMPDFENVVNKFIKTIEDNGLKLQFSDSTWFASGEFDVQYKKKAVKLNLLLTPHEARPRRFCWALVDVGGKDINQLADTTKWVGISPTDNELDFIELAGKSKTQRANFPGFRKPGKDIDYLSAFVALVQAGGVTINHCDKITYYFLNVPNFIFTVENFVRESSNSGWLISSIIPINDNQKQSYLKTFFNY
jgi:hypothetical protein